MSELDTYFQPTGRQFGQAGSLQSGTMSAMDRRQAVTNMQNDQRRRLELARRVQRQLGQQSRRGNVRAGLLALDFMDREAEAGQPIPAGISSYESNRARGAQTIMDNEDQAAQMDAVTQGSDIGTMGEINPPMQPVSNTGSLAQRTGVVAPSAPAAPAPNPSPMPSGQMDRSGSRFRVGATGNGEGGMLTDSDKELLDAGRRVSGLRPAGFGSRPGGQFGIQVSSVASPAPAPATPTPSPVAPAPSAPAEPVKIDEDSLPQETKDRVQALRDRNARFEDVRGFRQAMADGQYKAGMGRLASERANLDRETMERKQQRELEDLAWQAERNAIDERTLADQQEQARKVEANKKSRITKRSDVKEAEGSIFAGNAYRPVNWTQEDEDAAAADLSAARRAESIMNRFVPNDVLARSTLGRFVLSGMGRATGRALDPSKWNR